MGVIRKVDQLTDWCHPIVIVRKQNGKIRLCLDLTKLNLTVKFEFYQLQSVEETIATTGKECVVMSKLQPFTEIIETNAKNGLVPLVTSNVKLFLETIWSG